MSEKEKLQHLTWNSNWISCRTKMKAPPEARGDDVNRTMVCYFLSSWELEVSRTFSSKGTQKQKPTKRRMSF